MIVEIRQIVDRLNDEKSNGVANIRSDIKQIRSEIKASDNANELQIVTINEKLSNIQKIEKRVSKLETKISHDKPLTYSTELENKEETFRDSVLANEDRLQEIEPLFTAEKILKPTMEKKSVSSNCTKTSDTDTVIDNLGQRNSVFIRSPASRVIKRVPISDLQGPREIREEHTPTPSNGDLINFSPYSTISKLHNGVSAKNANEMDQGIKTHVFSESDNQASGGLSCAGTLGATSSDPREHQKFTHNFNENGALQNSISTNGFNSVNNRVYQNTATCDVPITRNNGSYGMPRTMNAPGSLPVGTVITPMGTVITDKRFENDQVPYQCPVENRFAVLQDKMYNNVLKVSDSVNCTSDVNESQGSIPVHVSSRTDKRVASRRVRYNPRPHPEPEPPQHEDDDSDDDFEMHIRRRSKRFYIGGFKPSISQPKLKHYVTRKGVRVTWISIRKYEKTEQSCDTVKC